jgi:signal transduction histidine kinase
VADDERLDRLIAAEQDERRRIALFLHDGPVQNLSGIALMLDAALHSISTGQLDDAQRVLGTALERQRTTIRELLEQAVRRGPPSRVVVRMRDLDDGGVETCVSDDAEPERRRRSFEAVEERVKQLHGTIGVDTSHGQTTVTVTLPPYSSRR